MSLRGQLVRLAHAHPELQAEILPLFKNAHGPVALPSPAVQLYLIDPSSNKSKFYEMRIVRLVEGAFLLQKRWGRLTDSGATGRVDAKDEQFGSMTEAQAAMAAHAREKRAKGYKDAPNGEYPIGLGAAGFGWGGQAACAFTPELREFHEKLKALTSDLEAFDRILAGLVRRKSAIAPKIAEHLQAIKGPVAALGGYLDHQLSSCDR